MAKELIWHGKSEEEVKKMDLKQFMEQVNARQRRSLKRGFNDKQKAFLKGMTAAKDNVRTHCRDMIILPQFIGKTIHVHGGREYVPVKITLEMVGHYLGEFSLSRKPVKHSAAGIGATRSSKAISAR